MNISKKCIDPIRQIMTARNNVLTTILYLKEFSENPENIEIIFGLEDALEALNLIQRWFMRNNNIFPK